MPGQYTFRLNLAATPPPTQEAVAAASPSLDGVLHCLPETFLRPSARTWVTDTVAQIRKDMDVALEAANHPGLEPWMPPVTEAYNGFQQRHEEERRIEAAKRAKSMARSGHTLPLVFLQSGLERYLMEEGRRPATPSRERHAVVQMLAHLAVAMEALGMGKVVPVETTGKGDGDDDT